MGAAAFWILILILFFEYQWFALGLIIAYALICIGLSPLS